MKTLIIIATILLATAAWSADTFTALTPDNTISDVDQVVVRKTAPIVQERDYTLAQIKTTLEGLRASLEQDRVAYEKNKAGTEAEIARYEALLAAVEPEAKKVTLKLP